MPPSKRDPVPPRLSMKHSKRELLEAYHQLAKQLQGLGDLPESRDKTAPEDQALRQAMSLSVEEILQNATDFRLELQTLFTKLANRIGAELSKFEQLQLAVEVKERELRERHGIEQCAKALADMQASQRQQREAFVEEMNRMRREWEREQASHAAEVQEREARENRDRARQEEAFQYSFKREQQLARDAFNDKMTRLLAEKEAIEEGIKQREAAIAAREEEIKLLEKQVKELPKAIERAVTEKVKAAQESAKEENALLQKQHRSEKSHLNSKLKALEATIKELNARLKRVSAQRDQAQEHLQTIALRGMETPPAAAHEAKEPSREPSAAKEKPKPTKSMIPPLSYQGQREFNA